MGPITTSYHEADAQVTTAPARRYGLLVGVTAAAANPKVILKDGDSGGTVLFTANLGDAAVGPVYIPFPADTYIRFDTKMYLDISGNVSDVTLFYQT